MYLSILGTFGFADPDPAATLRAWADRAPVRTVQAYRNTANAPTVEQMLAWARAAALTYDSLHGVFGDDYDPSSPDERVRRPSVEAYVGEADLALALGGPIVVVHPSPAMLDYDGADRATRWRQLERSIGELSEIGQAVGVEFLIENQPPHHPVGSDTAELVAAIRRCGREGIGVCFDAAHAHLAGDEVAALRSIGPLLRLVHASDNDGHSDDHLLCFAGSVNWAGLGRVLRETNFAGPLTLEVFLDAPQVHRQVTPQWIDRLRDLMGLTDHNGTS